MAMPSSLMCERDQLQRQRRGSGFWWLYRVGLTFCLLQRPLLSVLNADAWWSVPAALGILAGTFLVWWLAALAVESERMRIEQKRSKGLIAGWKGALPMVLVCLAFVMTIRPFTDLAWHPLLLPLLIFGCMVFVMEQALASQRANFDLLAAREQALRAKLAPHFIFNTLNTLHAQIEQDPRGAQATTERLAQLFRQVIAVADEPTLPLKQELEFVEAYLGIEQARLGDRLRVVIDIPESLETAQIPPLSLQVLVENAVKHGVAPLEQGGEVRIGAERREGVLWIWVEDPGTGVSPQKGTGTALETLRQRLEKPEDLVLDRVEGRHRVGIRWRQA
ncbi:sensor histidine kinase [Geothrix sp. 21YS21S-4]|uniref:sensor histidine kinase n=1 Tax=Geothrix sp. 21YS21S-4 TaxID=3068889 RepID=UPI0027B8DC5D|nr:histidine kinase [Geothrix sp. 21YS21S-4]